ncbi:hypothetical protein NWP18_06820 [Chrysosporum ovalisporum ANA283AFssAo]|nr:hypothetical protein [Umezakia ovalisporum]MDH6102168.1 hypothetical protein [Umezakia ovalisporum ANA283AFssAo]
MRYPVVEGITGVIFYHVLEIAHFYFHNR